MEPEIEEQILARFATALLQGSHPSQDADLALMTDASDFDLGASLNEITSNDFKPLGFFSKKLTPAQTKYSAFDHELLAAYSAIKYF
ncbi:retrovirus-related Pol polyprotein from transposon 17.6 [Trichonephila clavipes]|nr:retrovirus-related Pol polyprotein from transposon 17.6 [Trichonephila clavipes]